MLIHAIPIGPSGVPESSSAARAHVMIGASFPMQL